MRRWPKRKKDRHPLRSAYHNTAFWCEGRGCWLEEPDHRHGKEAVMKTCLTNFDCPSREVAVSAGRWNTSLWAAARESFDAVRDRWMPVTRHRNRLARCCGRRTGQERVIRIDDHDLTVPANLAQLHEICTRRLVKHPRSGVVCDESLVLDLRAAERVDSKLLAVLVELVSTARRQGIDLRVVPSIPLSMWITIYRLDGVLGSRASCLS